jgi:MYXO-CTERM domain-containing protein
VNAFLASLFALTLTVSAPPSLESAAGRIRAIDVGALEAALMSAGLEAPPHVDVTLRAEDDPVARDTAPWIVGRAFGDRNVLIFPARVTRYPYDSLESVMQHEIVHLALFTRAGGRPLPRWFHEGVATSVEAGWSAADQARLLFAALSEPTIGDVSGLFRSEAQPDTTLAYLLAAALVNDLRERHGPDIAGRIARRVEAGAFFDRAFARETGETPDAAAARAWATYRRWTTWVPAVANASTVWGAILALAVAAYIARRRRRARLRKQWEDGESWPFDT